MAKTSKPPSARPKADRPKGATKPKPGKKPKGKAKPSPEPKADAGQQEIDFKSPEYLAAHDRESVLKITTANDETERLKAAYDAKKEEAADAKKEWELQRTKLQRLIAERKQGYGKPPYTLFPDEIVAETLRHAPGARQPSAQTPGDVPEGAWFPPDLFKAYPLDPLLDHGLTKADLQALKDGVQKDRPTPFPILTVGDLSAFTDPSVMGYSRNLTDIKGLGPKAVERVENAMTWFWAEWPTLQEAFAAENGFKRPDSQDEAERAAADPKPKRKGEPSANGKAKSRTAGGDRGSADGGGNRATPVEGFEVPAQEEAAEAPQ